MNYEQTIEYIHKIPKFQRPLGNAKLRELLSELGNPQSKLKFIHVAGTNGKGSVSAMTAEILKKSGLRTGLFTSPFIERFNERIKVDGADIDDDELCKYVSYVSSVMEEKELYVSEFAFITAVAFLYFCNKRCDIVVLEVGMGGKLDATNVIGGSVVSVICKIGLDHTQYLGDTVEDIAAEKCGIIRKNGTVVTYPNTEVMEIIEKYVKENDAQLFKTELAQPFCGGFIYKGQIYPLSLTGDYQAQNAGVVIEIINALCSLGYSISKEDVLYGLTHTYWPARFEFVADRLIIDGGHNIDGIKALKQSLLSLEKPIVLVIAMMEDKSYEECICEILPIADAVFATEIDMMRCLAAEEISRIGFDNGVKTFVVNEPIQAVKQALERYKDSVVCVCGSLYLAGEVKKHIQDIF